MKYIRTKDGIYELDILSIRYIGETYFSCWDIKHTRVFNNWHILKQADTIEKLCDGYVITSKQGHIYDSYGDYGYELKEVLPQAKEECPDEDWNLYGCILVDGIIKQVAKLNDDKGELELI